MIPFSIVCWLCFLSPIAWHGRPLALNTGEGAVSVRVSLLCCYRDGPFILDVELENQGNEAIEIGIRRDDFLTVAQARSAKVDKHLHQLEANGSNYLRTGRFPKRKREGWEKIEAGRPGSPNQGDAGSFETLAPNKRLTRRYYLHETHELCHSLVAVDANLRCRFRRSGNRIEAATLRSRFWALVLEFTPAARRQTAAALMHQLDADQSAETARQVLRSVLGAFGSEFVPVALRLLRHPDTPAGELIDHIYLCSPDVDAAFRVMKDDMSRDGLPTVAKCFRYWRDAKNFRAHIGDLEREVRTPLPKALGNDVRSQSVAETEAFLRKLAQVDLERYRAIDKARGGIDVRPKAGQIRELLDGPNPWASAVAAIYFPDTVRLADLDGIVRRLANRMRQLSNEEWNAILARLNDQRFSVRKEAMREVSGLGERAIRRLEALSKAEDANLAAMAGQMLEVVRSRPMTSADEWVLVECANQRNFVSERLVLEFSKMDHLPTVKATAERIIKAGQEAEERARLIKAEHRQK